jgi:DNA repair photolyase
MRNIKRGTLIYKTGVEYGDYAVNHVQGCAHNCQYPCYARILKRVTEDDWCNPAIVRNAMELLEKELPRLEGRIANIHMCFSSDPFMLHYPEVAYLTLRLMSAINGKRIPVTTLTKGVYPVDALRSGLPGNSYGITLVSLDEGFRKRMEPGAAPIAARLESLRQLHDIGKRTWVSIEPYPTPNIITQDVRSILGEVAFVDKIIFGRMNYSSTANAQPDAARFYADMANEVVRFCKTRSIRYHIKTGTMREDQQKMVKSRGRGRVRNVL